jgi:hypothetical protein
MWNRVDFLITGDRRIVDRAPRLASIRPIEILTPAEFSETREGHPDPPPGSAPLPRDRRSPVRRLTRNDRLVLCAMTGQAIGSSGCARPGEVMAEIPKRIGERHSGKLAAGEVAVGPLIGPLGYSSARTQPNSTERCPAPERRNPARERGFGQAAEGIRTLDLLHGKQTL